jgi:hypothetical protein
MVACASCAPPTAAVPGGFVSGGEVSEASMMWPHLPRHMPPPPTRRAARSSPKRLSAPAKAVRNSPSARSSCAKHAAKRCASSSVMNDRSRQARPRNRTAAAPSFRGSEIAVSTTSAAASSRSTCLSSDAAVRAASRSPPASARRRRVSGVPCAGHERMFANTGVRGGPHSGAGVARRLSAIAANSFSAASRSSTISWAITSGGGRLSMSSSESSRSQTRSRLTLSRCRSSS